MKGGNDIQFSSINREEYANLEDFLKSKKIKIKSVAAEESIISYAELDEDEGLEDEDEDDFGSRKKRRTDVGAADMDEDEDEESRKF